MAGCRPFRELIDTSDPPFAQLLSGVLGDDERPVQADVDDAAKLVDRQLGDQAETAEARAVDHDIEWAGLGEKPFHRGLVGDVDLCGGVWLAQFRGPLARTVRIEVGDRDPAAVGGQRLRRRPADAGRPADDHAFRATRSVPLLIQLPFRRRVERVPT